MKFQFEGLDEIIEINYDFSTSEFISVLEPDESIPVLIPEKFSKFSIYLFKELLEKITNKEELTLDDRKIFNTSILTPLIEYFRMNKELKELFNEYYYVLTHKFENLDTPWGIIRNPNYNYFEIFKTFEEAKTKLYQKIIENKFLIYYRLSTEIIEKEDDKEDEKEIILKIQGSDIKITYEKPNEDTILFIVHKYERLSNIGKALSQETFYINKKYYSESDTYLSKYELSPKNDIKIKKKVYVEDED
jgi:hypothetical protein